MAKYYRVMKDTFMWREGAIISDEEEQSHYVGIEDVWDVTEDQTEYISANIIEHPNNSEFFQRVYPTGDEKKSFRTADEVRESYKKTI